MTISPGTILGSYEILSLLGIGGMGEVYRARDPRLGRDVAIKILPSEYATDPNSRRRFEREARSVASLNHPNICTIHEIGEANNRLFIVMECVDGEPLSQITSRAPILLETAIEYMCQIVDGVAHAHEHHIVHRDLKGSNVIITANGRAKVLDFGLAKELIRPGVDDTTESRLSTVGHTIRGTLAYMPPEVLRGEPADERSDVWALGVLLFTMVTTRLPFNGKTAYELSAAILNGVPDPLPRRVPAALSVVVNRCLTKDPTQRYQHASEVRAALQPIQVDGRTRAWSHRSIALIVLLSALAAIAFLPRTWERGNVPAGHLSIASARPLIAVLGFKNVTGHHQVAWIGTAVSEMLSTELAAGGRFQTVPGENVARMRIDLKLPEQEGFAADSLARIRKHLGADLVVFGSYVALDEAANGQIRLDLRLEDLRSGDTLLNLGDTGTQGNLFELISDFGGRLRRTLGADELSAAEAAPIRASLPSGANAVRLYAEGLASLRVFDALAARNLLEKAITADPGFPMAHSALAEAWAALGYDANATDEAKRAVELSAVLPREERLLIEGRYRESTREWPQAIDCYKTLVDFFPDNLDYGLRLAAAQTSSGSAASALDTVSVLRKLPSRAAEDPRIDLAEAVAAGALSNHKQRIAAAEVAIQKARTRGAQLIVARAEVVKGFGLAAVGELTQATRAFNDAKQIYSASGNRAGVALTLINDAGVRYQHGDLATAEREWEQALAIAREIGDRSNSAMALNNIGAARSAQGDLTAATRAYDESLRISREVLDRAGIARALHNIGELRRFAGQLIQAKRLYTEALAIRRDLANQTGVASTLHGLANLLCDEGNLTAAKAAYGEAVLLYSRLGQKWVLAATRLDLASLLLEDGHASDAEALAQVLADEFHVGRQSDSEALARATLARAYRLQQRRPEASAQAERALALLDGNQNADVRLSVWIAAGSVLISLDRSADGLPYVKRALLEATRTGFVRQRLTARLAIAKLEIQIGDRAAGRSHLQAVEAEAKARGYGLLARKAGATPASSGNSTY